MPPVHSHSAGALRQRNKTHKGRAASKRLIKKAAGGRTQVSIALYKPCLPINCCMWLVWAQATVGKSKHGVRQSPALNRQVMDHLGLHRIDESLRQ
jgi:hypothetical protein